MRIFMVVCNLVCDVLVHGRARGLFAIGPLHELGNITDRCGTVRAQVTGAAAGGIPGGKAAGSGRSDGRAGWCGNTAAHAGEHGRAGGANGRGRRERSIQRGDRQEAVWRRKDLLHAPLLYALCVCLRQGSHTVTHRPG